MYNYLVSSGTTFIVISVCISGCKFNTTLNEPIDFISLTGCIKEGFISIFSFRFKSFAISVGLTDPYNSLFSVANLLTLYSLF